MKKVEELKLWAFVSDKKDFEKSYKEVLSDVEALPEYAILAQISFGALLNAKTRAARNRFDRKIADFAICNKKTAEVLALIELDDSSHRGKEAQDAARDDMLNRAGYTVLRYARVPSAAEVRADMKKVLAHLKRQRR